ncbi:hypothetical protein Dsin_028937 [Dipteronia sinensis]|uniref:Rad60/SUMO-like domain-containing protein n=1 Tax=Dipteronia sinensis TaxID=43782 RepID=A0AAD9ZT02_9ROSI|nr:hypothetical protein Dsin_028937 [Dipteronia sinensis]
MEDIGETEDLEPLFDYRRVQPHVIYLNDDKSPASTPKRRKTSKTHVGKKVEGEKKEIAVVNCDEEEDWLPPPPKVLVGVQNQLDEDSTIKEMRLKKQELLSVVNSSAEDVLREMDESAKRKSGSSLQASLETLLAAVAEQPSKPPCERLKIVIQVQDKDGTKQFRMYMDDKLERLFKMYADKVKLDLQNLVFTFDGDKIGPTATPGSLGMDDEDMIEVHEKRS